MTNARVAVVGGGPAGLMAAETLAGAGMAVTVFDRMPSVGRKLLIAGRGGLNITHSEAYDRFVARYGDAPPPFRAALDALTPDDIRTWAEGLGQEMFVGSSGRVFPRSWKASPLLRAWLSRLGRLGVRFAPNHTWQGFAPDGALLFGRPGDDALAQSFDAAILALGGASWPRLGSDGRWVGTLESAGIAVSTLRAANGGLQIAWSETFRARFEGQPLKRVALSFGSLTQRGDAVVTATGLEGGAVYPLSSSVGQALARSGAATLAADLRPDLSREALTEALARPHGKQSMASVLRKSAGLSPISIGVLREVYGADLPRDPGELAHAIKALPLRAIGTEPMARAISSAGGVTWAELDGAFMLRRRPGVFVAGEMLDWDAPTGGYLLTACLATGAAAGRGAIAWLLGRHAHDEARALVPPARPRDPGP